MARCIPIFTDIAEPAVIKATVAELDVAADGMDRDVFIALTEGLPRRQLCELLGIDYTTLARYRSGRLPSPRWLAVIVILLHWSVATCSTS